MRNRSPSLLTRLLGLVAAYWVFSMSIIFVHEAAHYAVAQAHGIGVFKFQVGYGPTLIEFSTGNCSYELGLYPTGGFNAIAQDYRSAYGPEVIEQLIQENPEVEQYLDKPDTWMENKPPLAKFLVAMAGVVSQIGIALIMLAVLWFTRHRWLLYPKFQQLVDVPIRGEDKRRIGIKRVLLTGRQLNFWKAVFLWLFVSNISLAISNTAPIPSLDGMLALQSFAAMVHGDALTPAVMGSMIENATVAFLLINAVFSLVSLLAFILMFVVLFFMPMSSTVLERVYFPGFEPELDDASDSDNRDQDE